MLQMAVRRDYGIGIGLIEGALSYTSSLDQLRDWLAGRGALLFSHPEDFASYGFEADRWIVYLQEAFDRLRLRAMAIGHDDGSGWISQLGGRFIASYEVGDLVPQLRGGAFAKTAASEHFVTILDSSGRARRTFVYQPGGQVPSIIELAHTAAQLCERAAPASIRRVLQSV